MITGKTIRLWLMDGDPSGPIAAEIINWSGQVILVPRAQLADLVHRSELQGTGIYALVGSDELNRVRVYIGEGDDVFARLKEHDGDESKDWWTRAVVVTSKDDNLTKAHARYLECRLLELARIANKCALSNGTCPPPKRLPEPDKADMEYFLRQIQLVLPVLGFDFLRETPNPVLNDPVSRGQRLVMDEVGVKAHAYEINGRFIVIKGSTARRQSTPSWDSYRPLRESLEQSGSIVVQDQERLVFNDDVEFTSPSAAATVIAAGNRNGRTSWKVEESGQTYAAWKAAEIDRAARIQ